MKLVSVALMYLGSLAFLGADTARLDVASQFRKKWNKWALSRGKRELRMSSSYPTGLADVKAGPAQTLIQPQDMKGASQSSGALAAASGHARCRSWHTRSTSSQIRTRTTSPPGARSAPRAMAAGAGAPCPRPAWVGL